MTKDLQTVRAGRVHVLEVLSYLAGGVWKEERAGTRAFFLRETF